MNNLVLSRTLTRRVSCVRGWNRFAIEVADLEAVVRELRTADVHFRNDVVTGVGGKQVIVDDPSGSPVGLFQPTLPEAKLGRQS